MRVKNKYLFLEWNIEFYCKHYHEKDYIFIAQLTKIKMKFFKS